MQKILFYLLLEGDVIIAINLFPPIYDKEKYHSRYYSSSWMETLTTGNLEIRNTNFVKNSHLNRDSEEKLEIKNTRHKKGEIKFIDSDQAHVVFQP